MIKSSHAPVVSVLLPAKNSARFLERSVSKLHRYLSGRFGNSFEIVIIPNPSIDPSVIPLSESTDETLKLAYELSDRFTNITVAPHEAPVGKGAALKSGFMASSGRWIFITDSDLPYNFAFFDQANFRLRNGFDLIVGNRRHRDSSIFIPRKLLGSIFVRNVLGLIFNRAVRSLFKSIWIRDTQAGIKAMTREFAERAFELQTCPGFFGDVEILLTAIGHSRHFIDLPVTFELRDDESSIRFFREAFRALRWLGQIWWQEKRGHYDLRSDVEVETPLVPASNYYLENTRFEVDYSTAVAVGKELTSQS